MCFFFFKKKTAYEMRISDGSSDVCSSDRTELYAVADDDGQALADWLATHPGAGGDSGTGPGQALHAYLYHHRDGDAVRHLFRVATGLDSLVLGEPQILGQVKPAWATAPEARTPRGQPDRLVQTAFVDHSDHTPHTHTRHTQQ